MDPQLYNGQAREALASAQRLAEERCHNQMEPEHLLFALMDAPPSAVRALLERQRARPNVVKRAVERALEPLPVVTGARPPLSVSPRLRATLERAQDDARALGDAEIAPEHLLLALADSQTGGDVARIMDEFDLGHDALLADLRDLRTKQGGQRMTAPNPENPSGNAEENAGQSASALARYGRDLTALAREGRLDPVIGRDDEVRRVIQALARRTKNNPVLIGEPGVGKTAIVEGLAQRIARGDVPEALKDKRLIALDLAAMVAGAKLRGEFEERLKSALKEITDAAGQIIVFLDELHTVVGAGAGEGAMGASDMLKPLLARGELHMVGATTLDEYRQHIEKDAALERRFQPVYVGEPSVEDTISILRGLRERYEQYHKTRIKDAAIVAAATLSHRYISDRYLPDKAIDLIDEAASRIRMEATSMPRELDEVNRRAMQLEVEAVGLRKETDPDSQERLQRLEGELADLRQQRDQLQARWRRDLDELNAVSGLQEELNATRTALEQAEARYDWEQIAELRYNASQIEQRLKEAIQAREAAGERPSLVKDVVDEQDIAEVVSAWTGIPVTRLMQGEANKLLKMEDRLRQRVIGQDHALGAVANAVRATRAGLQDPNRPLGSFLFLGPTGVGKTETARALAEFLFDDDRAMIRIDMSEYQEKFTVNRLIGAPPGYVGYEEAGQLTEAVRRRPYSVVLFDEVEKAAPDVLNVLLQLLDDGRLTDGQGRVVNFRNVIVIMTSNLGGEVITERGLPWDEIERRVLEALRQALRPELLNRIDEVIVFHALDQAQMGQMVELQLRDLRARLAERRMTLELT
ncbi:MAG TPA: AAA family ATPase, partial [Ktedonobacterales bacterium]|nr:AAA family ATPase [Ktedonobacterales bacterium]